jgi:FMN-dependent NADH-azoreductase
MNLLHIDCSALGTHSVSRELGAAIVAAWKRAHPAAKVTYRDVAAQPLPNWTPVADADDPAAHAGAKILGEFLAAMSS